MRRIIVMLLCLCPLIASAEVLVLPLQHRTVEEILPLVRPLLEPDGAATGMNSQLILRGSAQNLAEIRAILPTLDVAARRMRIWVRQGLSRRDDGRQVGASGTVGLGRDARVTVVDPVPAGGLVIQSGQGADGLSARMQAVRNETADERTQQVQALEGHPAQIRIGQSLPMVQRQWAQAGGQLQVVESIAYREVESGFQALPRISGNTVTLEIYVQNDQPGVAVVNTQRLLTTVSGRPGEWLSLGGQQRQGTQGASRVLGADSQKLEELSSVQLKVELLP